jgi:hypothetical protein
VTEHQTWFEAQLDWPLAILLDRICKVYNRTGQASRAALLDRVEQAIARENSPSGR